MVLSRQQVTELFARDADKYEAKKESARANIKNFDPFSTGAGALFKTGVGAVAGGLTGGLGGAVAGGIKGAGANNPIDAGLGGMSAGTGLTQIGGVEGLMNPDNALKSAEFLKGMSGSSEDAMSKIGKITQEDIDKKNKRKIELEDAKTKRANELADMKTKQEYAKELALLKKTNTTKKADPKVQRENFVSAKTNIAKAKAKYADDPEMLSQYLVGLQDVADSIYAEGNLSQAQYNAIIKLIEE